MKELRIKFNPTGNVFVLPEEEALRIYREPGNNYTILDDDFVDEEPKEEETSVYQQIVEEEVVNKEVKPAKKSNKKDKKAK